MSDSRQGGQGRARARGRTMNVSQEGRGQPPAAYGGGQPVVPPSTVQGPRSQPPLVRPSAPGLGASEGRALTHRDTPGRGAVIATTESGSADNGNGNRGAHRGKRLLHDVLRTRPAEGVSKKGATGDVITLQANYFRLKRRMEWILFQYRVDFTPQIHNVRFMYKLLADHARKFGGYIFDGTQLFMSNKLSTDDCELDARDERTNEIYKITITRTGSVDMTNEQGLQVLNLILRKAMGGLKLQLVGRNLFDAAAKIDIREYKIELWPGYITSIRQHEQDVLLCCEIAHKTMRMQTVYDVLLDCRKSSRDYRDAFKREILGCVVLTDYNNKTYRIDDVTFETTPESTFATKSGDTSFLDYYRTKYNLKIRDPKQPMLLSRAKKKDLRGGQQELMALVPELCKMTGLTDQMRTDFRMMRSMSEHTRLNPDKRIDRLLKFNDRLQSSSESQVVFKNWNTELDTKLVEFPARQYKPEMIYFSPATDGVNAGDLADWTHAFRNNPMFSSVNLNRWFLIFPERCSREAADFLRCMQDSARGMKFNISDPNHIRIRDDRPDSYASALENCANKDPQMIICVVTNNKADRYTTIKKKCCIERGIPTQVLVQKTITPKGGNVRTLMSVATKVVIQLNCKLGGVPWKVKIPMNGIMTIGFDVSHDAQDKSKSFGAMVCTMENDYKAAPKFFSCVSQHQYGEEISNYLSLNVAKAMQEYRRVYGCLPKKIFFYRDGVGEGQLQHVYDHEVSSIRAQLDNIYKTAGVTDPVCFTFFVVNKRINTRFFHKKQNPKPGTIVDDVITLPERTDFYLVSQSVRQGTVSPTAYNILYDTSSINIDRLQQLTYKMCHLYYNWSGTTRVPAVCQYAHKLAFLVGQFLHQSPNHNLEKQLYFL